MDSFIFTSIFYLKCFKKCYIHTIIKQVDSWYINLKTCFEFYGKNVFSVLKKMYWSFDKKKKNTTCKYSENGKIFKQYVLLWSFAQNC